MSGAIVMPSDPTWACSECGCTDLAPCVNADGETCFWAKDGLCSACAGDDLDDAIERSRAQMDEAIT